MFMRIYTEFLENLTSLQRKYLMFLEIELL